MYKVTVWCEDCMGDDDELGCFEGQTFTMEERFNTEEEAEAAGEEFTKDCSQWVYKIEEADAYKFSYRGGEITAKVNAPSLESARARLGLNEGVEYTVNADSLHADFWERIRD